MDLLQSDASFVGDRELVRGELAITVTKDDLVTMANAIGEAIEAVEDWEFQTRVGVTSQYARELQAQIAKILQDTYVPE